MSGLILNVWSELAWYIVVDPRPFGLSHSLVWDLPIWNGMPSLSLHEPGLDWDVWSEAVRSEAGRHKTRTFALDLDVQPTTPT